MNDRIHQIRERWHNYGEMSTRDTTWLISEVERLQAAILEEREACARIADDEIAVRSCRRLDENDAHGLVQTSLRIAKDIRKRGKT